MADDDLDPRAELARINRRGFLRNAQGATATWAAVIVFLVVGGAIAAAGIVLALAIGIESRQWTYVCLGAGVGIGGVAAAVVRHRIEPKHPEDE
jgi:uncharacterized membrane protein YgcG